MPSPSPLNLDDAALDQIMAACAPLAPRDRDPFVRAVADELRGCREIGPGVVHRVIAVMQRRFFDPPNLHHALGTYSKYR